MVTRNDRRALRGLVVARALEAAASTAMLPFIVLWAHREAGLGGATAGVLFIVQAIGEFGTGVLAGGLADRLGRRRVLVLSTAGAALSYGLLALASAPVLAIGLFLVAGVFESAFHPTVAAMVGDVVPDDDLVRSFGWVRAGANVGRIVGPLLGALVAAAALGAVFVLAGGLLAATVVVLLFLVPGRPRGEGGGRSGDPDDREVPPGTLRALRSDSRLAVVVLGGGLLSITFAWWEADGLVLLRLQTEVGAGEWASLFTLAAVVALLFQLPLASWAQRLGTRRALVVGAALQGLGLASLTAASAGYGVLAAAVVMMALGEVIYLPTVSAVVTRLAPPEQRASYQAALSITEDVGTAVGPTSGLALAGPAGPIGLWASGAALALCAGLTTSRAVRARDTVRPR